ncbi:MAG: Ig-like domain-containing protein [Candidatus Latescibacterota bacterium]
MTRHLRILPLGFVLSPLFALPAPASAQSLVESGQELPGVWAGAAAWADYDGDGDLDLALVGETLDEEGRPQRIARICGGEAGGLLSEHGAAASQLVGVYHGDVAWADYDSDGDLDLAIVGWDVAGDESLRLYANESGSGETGRTLALDRRHVDAAGSPVLQGVRYATLAWADYDSDGDPDLLVCGMEPNGTSLTRLYRNAGGVLQVDEGNSQALVNLHRGDVAWADYDNDGDLDLAVSGENVTTTGGLGAVTEFYRNDPTGTLALDAALQAAALKGGSLAWADWDGDGNLDLALSGRDSGWNAGLLLYRNRPLGVLTLEDRFSLGAARRVAGALAWADYDNDGDVDLAASGSTILGMPQAFVFPNQGGQLSAVSAEPDLAGLAGGATVWGDGDGDGRLDLLLTGVDGEGQRRTLLYGNQGALLANQPPAPPQRLNPARVTSSRILFSWAAATDPEGSALTYNLRVGTEPGAGDVVSGALVPGPGNAGMKASFALARGVPRDVYYWSVQSVDAGLTPGAWSQESVLNVQQFASSDQRLRAANEAAMAWGDFDADGDLDGCVLGMNRSGAAQTTLYRNEGNTMAATQVPLLGLHNGAAAWGDYDSDGDLDLVLTGEDTFENRHALLYAAEPGADGYELVPIGRFPNLGRSSAAWADYDNDGDLDLVLMGQSDEASGGVQQSRTLLFANDGEGGLTETDDEIIGLNNGDLAWADCDGDGDVDLAVTGSSSSGSRELRLYRNDGGHLVDAELGLEGLESSDLAWADYDGDGDPDLVAGGISAFGVQTVLYANDGLGGLAPQPVVLPGIRGGDLAWGDYDNDQKPDLVVAGNDGSAPILRLFRNTGMDLEADPVLVLQGLEYSALALMDVEGDGDLDLVSAGRDAAFVPQALVNDNLESQYNPNRPPQPPTSLTAADSADAVLLAWHLADDEFEETPASLTYTVRVGRTAASGDILSGAVPLGPGNAGHTPFRRLYGLPSGTYHWSVQTVDDGLARSPWSADHTFLVDTVPPRVDRDGFRLGRTSYGIGQTVNLALTFVDEHSGVDVTHSPQMTATLGDSAYGFETLQFAGSTWSGALAITAQMPSGEATIAVRGVVDGRGNALVPFDTLAAFTLDTAPPRLEATSPAAGQEGVPVSLAELGLTFSEALEPGTLTAESFRIEQGGQPVAQLTDPVYEAETRTVRLFPAGGLQVGSQYSVTVSAAIADLAGNRMADGVTWRFGTQVPRLVETSPLGSGAAPATDRITATFDGPLYAPALTAAEAVRVTRDGQAQPLATAPQFSEETGVLSCQVAGGLKPGSRYEVTLSGLLAGPLRLQQGGDFTWQFETPVPELAATSPDSGEAVAAAVPGILSAVFDAPVDAGALNGGAITVLESGIQVPVEDPEYNPDTRTVRLTLSGGLRAGTAYEVRLPAAAGGAIRQSPYTWRFTTLVPRITGVEPDSGAADVAVSLAEAAVTFSTPIDPAQAIPGNFVLLREGTPLALRPGDPVARGSGRYGLAPQEGWRVGSRYSVQVLPAVSGPLGPGQPTIWSFHTQVPGIERLRPAEGDTGVVAADAEIAVVFTGPVDAATLRAQDGVRLLQEGQPLLLAGLTYDADRRTLTFRPEAGLRAGTGYEVIIASAVGGPLRQELGDFRWRFRTLVPRVTAFEPDPGAADVAVDLAEATVTFSAPIDAAQAVPANFVLLREGSPVALRPGDPVARGSGRYGLAPQEGWRVGSRYSVQVLPAVSGPLGPQAATSWGFSTSVPDTVRVSPAAGDTAVSATAGEFTVVFDRPADEAALRQERGVRVLQDGQAVPLADLAYDATRTTLTFRPQGGLRAGTAYEVTVAAAAGGPLRQDTGDFRWRFSTRVPAVQSIVPEAGAAVRSGTRRVQVSFSAPLDADLVTPQNFRLSLGGSPLDLEPGEFLYDAATFTVSYPAVDLAAGSAYRASVSSRVGGPLGADRPDTEWSFTTQVPQVVGTWPAHGEDGVSTQVASIQVAFSQPVAQPGTEGFRLLALSLPDTTAAPELVAITSPSTRDSAGTVILSFAPEGGLRPFTRYEVSVAREVLGALATSGYGWVFRTAGYLADAAAGGTVANGDGSVEVYFPPGALPLTSAEVQIRRLDPSAAGLPGPQEGLTQVTPAYQISVPAELRKPASLTMGYTPGELGSRDATRLGVFALGGSRWERVGGAPAQGRAAVRTVVDGSAVVAVFEDLTTAVGTPAVRDLDCQPRAFSPTGSQGRAQTDISFTLTGPANVTVRVYNAAGRLERVVTRQQPMAPGRIPLAWDGTDEDGDVVASGLYVVVVEAGGKRQEKVVAVVR